MGGVTTADVNMREAKVGGRVVIRTAPLRDAVLRVTEVEVDGTITGTLLNPLVLDPLDYDVISDE